MFLAASLSNKRGVFSSIIPRGDVSLLWNIAASYSTLGKYSEAERLYRQVVEREEEVLGKDHPDTLNSQNNLAIAFYGQGKHKEAEQLDDGGLRTSRFALSLKIVVASVGKVTGTESEQGIRTETAFLWQ